MKVAELFEGKEQNIAQLRKDYKNAMAWVNAPQNEVPNHERAKWERQAQKLRDHAKKQYKIDLSEEIKGWKHAGRDLAKMRADKGKDVKLVRLKKDGTESKMNDATKTFRSEEEARRHHENMVKLNPKTAIKHHLYVDGKPQLLESEVIRPEEAGWYVCDYKERPVHGPMSEMKAKALAEQLSKDDKSFTAEYFSDYQISRMNEGVDKRRQSQISQRAKSAAEELRDRGYSAQIKTRVIGRAKSERTVMMVTHKTFVDSDEVMRVLKNHEVPFATVRSQRLGGGKHEMMVRLVEGVAPPFTKFKKGQIVKVKKTGEKVEVLSQNDIGLVQTVKVGGGVPAFPKGKGSVVQGKDHQEYMPRELE